MSGTRANATPAFEFQAGSACDILTRTFLGSRSAPGASHLRHAPDDCQGTFNPATSHGARQARTVRGIAAGVRGPRAYDLGTWWSRCRAFAMSLNAVFVCFTVAKRVFSGMRAVASRDELLHGGFENGITRGAARQPISLGGSSCPQHIDQRQWVRKTGELSVFAKRLTD